LGISIAQGQNMKTFEIFEMPVYQRDTTTAVLEMGYASAQISNPAQWTSIRAGAIPTEIELVFTDYPKDSSRWRHPYTNLLMQRVAHLLDIDSSLAYYPVRWKMIEQTACHSEAEAKKMLHAWVIHYKRAQNPSAEQHSPTPEKQSFEKEPAKENITVLAAEKEPQKTGITEINPTEKYYEPKYIAPEDTLSSILDRMTSGIRVVEEIYSPYEIREVVEGRSELKNMVIGPVLDRHPEWRNMLVVMDWTGSMYQYGAEILLWHQMHKEAGNNLVHDFVLFNDGHFKRDNKKEIGKTGGIYHSRSDTLEHILQTMDRAMQGARGGDPQENDIEALLVACRELEVFGDIILIADNSAVRDIELLSEVERPIHVILCDPKGNYINPDYARIAFETGGSLHTLKDDLETLSETLEKYDIGGQYEIINGKLKRLPE